MHAQRVTIEHNETKRLTVIILKHYGCFNAVAVRKMKEKTHSAAADVTLV